MFDVKADGWFNLLHALGDAAPRTAVVFSSIAGPLRQRRPDRLRGRQRPAVQERRPACAGAGGTRGIAIDWTAWAGIGMASRGSIPKMMEVAGIDMLPPEVGVPVVRRELTAPAPGGEVVVAGALGVLLEERHATGGARSRGRERAPPSAGPDDRPHHRDDARPAGSRVRTELDPGRQAFLARPPHRGTPVLPGVMGMEAFAEAARASAAGLAGRRARGRRAAGAVQVLPRRAAHARAARAGPRRRRRHARRRLRAGRPPDAARPGRAGDAALHGPRPPRAARRPAAPPASRATRRRRRRCASAATTVYRVYFHGPAYQVLERAWREDGHVVGRLARRPAARPRAARASRRSSSRG